MKNNRDYKNFTKGYFYHLYNRGNEKSLIFRDEEDYVVFIFYMREALGLNQNSQTVTKKIRRVILPQGCFTLDTYCLMPNHFHLLIKQNSDISLSKLITKISTGYSKYFNKKYNRVGSLFQDSFKSVLIESESQLLWTREYIDFNPVRVGMVKDALEYKWNNLNNPLQ